MHTAASQASEDKQSVTDYLEQSVLSAQVMGEASDQGMLDDVEQLRGEQDWRDLRLPEPLVRRIEDDESQRGPVSLIHYLHAIDNTPVLMLAQTRVDARPEETVIFSYSETTITVASQRAVAHTVLCRRGF